MTALCPDLVADLDIWRNLAAGAVCACGVALVFVALLTHAVARGQWRPRAGFDAMREPHGDVPRPLPSRRWSVR